MRNIQTFAIILVASLGLVACGGHRAVEEDIEIEVVEGELATEATASSLDDDDLVAVSNTGESASPDPLNTRVIYFDYDSSALTPESEAIIQAHANYLAGTQGARVIFEGHADERGTREYNLALGEDRAVAVSNLMQALGVSANRIQTVSYGEERPVSLGSDEGAWAQNRRVEILYQ